jgi:hypothetical protein
MRGKVLSLFFLGLLVCLGCIVCLGGCTEGPAPLDAPIAPMDGGVDASELSPSDAPRDAPPACDVAPAPSDLAMLRGGFVVLSPDAGLPIPAMTGGDPVGVWRFDTVTIYTGSTSAGMFDPSTSTIEGTAWAVVEGDTIRIQLNLDIALMGTAAGTVRRRTETTIRGSYVALGSSLSITPVCISPMPSGGSMVAPSFTAEGTTGSIQLTVEGMLGTNQIVLSGMRTPS